MNRCLYVCVCLSICGRSLPHGAQVFPSSVATPQKRPKPCWGGRGHVARGPSRARMAKGAKSRPLAVYRNNEEMWTFIKDFLSKHRGEVREIDGRWQFVDAPFPTEPKYFQYCHTPEEAQAMLRWDGTCGKGPFAGKKGKGGKKPASWAGHSNNF